MLGDRGEYSHLKYEMKYKLFKNFNFNLKLLFEIKFHSKSFEKIVIQFFDNLDNDVGRFNRFLGERWTVKNVPDLGEIAHAGCDADNNMKWSNVHIIVVNQFTVHFAF